MLNILVHRMFSLHSLLHLFYGRYIYSVFSEKNNYLFLWVLFLPRQFLCLLNSFYFTFILVFGFHIWGSPQMFNDPCCPEWGFKIPTVIPVRMGGACQLRVSLSKDQGLGKLGHSQISTCVSFLLVKFFPQEKKILQFSILHWVYTCMPVFTDQS